MISRSRSKLMVQDFGVSENQNLLQLTKIVSVCQADSMRLYHWVKQNCRLNCAIMIRLSLTVNDMTFSADNEMLVL